MSRARRADDAKAIVLRYIEDVWNGGDPNGLDALTTGDFAYHLGDAARARPRGDARLPVDDARRVP